MADPPTDIAAALEDLRTRLAAVEADRDRGSGRAPGPGGDPATFWLLEGLVGNTGPAFSRDGVAGSVAYGGRVRAPGTGEVSWQMEHAAPDVADADLDAAADVLAALGHPLRLRILRRLLGGATTLAELHDPADGGTSGQLHHHLRELRAAGLVASPRRNHYEIPAERVVPVLVLIAAALGRSVGTGGDA